MSLPPKRLSSKGPPFVPGEIMPQSWPHHDQYMRPEDYEDTPYRDPNDGLNNSNALNSWTPSPTPGAVMRPEDYEDQAEPKPRAYDFRLIISW